MENFKASKDSDENGWTALHSAASKGHADAVQLLLEAYMAICVAICAVAD